MKKFSLIILSLIIGTFFVSCNSSNTVKDSGSIKVVATNSIIADMTKNVGGDLIELHSIVPIGTDPHEYETLPEDITRASEADVIFYNGLNLETGGNGWFKKLMDISKKKENEDYFAVSKGVAPLYLTSKGQESEQDPHAWLDIENGIKYVDNIEKVLITKDPVNKETYTKNASEYKSKLKELHNNAKEKFKDIGQDKKLLVTSEGAFKYFSNAYELMATYIWEINTENQGSPEQMTKIINTINKSKVPSLFVETSVDKRSMERVSSETKRPIYSTIFTDSIAKEGEEGDSYYSMMEWNLNKIHEGLSK